jgi:hypothetical protein
MIISIDKYDPYKIEWLDFGKELRVETWSFNAQNTILMSLQNTYNKAKIEILNRKTIYTFNNELIITIECLEEDNIFKVIQESIFGNIETLISKYDDNGKINRWYEAFVGFYSPYNKLTGFYRK